MANATVNGKTLSEKESKRGFMYPATRPESQRKKDEESQKLADEIEPQPLGYAERMNDFTKDTEIKSGRQLAEEGKKMAKGGKVKKMAKGGSASSRADGCATKGKTKGRFV